MLGWRTWLLVIGALSATTFTACQPEAKSDATVVRVIDGDTLDVRIGLAQERIRLISVDSPEARNPTECFGPEASRRTAELVPPGTRVGLERDVTEHDRFGRLLRYVYLPDGRLLSAVLIAEGFAEVVFYPPDRRFLSVLRAAEQSAQADGLGLWGAC